MTKEEVYKKHLFQTDWEFRHTHSGNRDLCLAAMDEYAKIMALKFFEFERGVPVKEMESNYDWFLSQQPTTNTDTK